MATINLAYYKGNDIYSDGDIEDYFLKELQNNKKGMEIIEKNPVWAAYYHFSEDRKNLLRWIDFDKSGSILEIGGGCGALTGHFLDSFASVTVIELSKRRAEICFERHKVFKNLEVIVGDLKEININQKYDVVTSIGVLEYARYIFDNEHSHLDFLLKCKSCLKVDGRFILAIENKLGLKYWAGAKEDHTGNYFDGINGYQNSKIETFSRSELTNLLKAAGFNRVQYYYPYPDYKFCDQVFSDEYLPHINQLSYENVPNFDYSRLALFSERYAANQLIADGVIKNFMNSFLVIAS